MGPWAPRWSAYAGCLARRRRRRHRAPRRASRLGSEASRGSRVARRAVFGGVLAVLRGRVYISAVIKIGRPRPIRKSIQLTWVRPVGPPVTAAGGPAPAVPGPRPRTPTHRAHRSPPPRRCTSPPRRRRAAVAAARTDRPHPSGPPSRPAATATTSAWSTSTSWPTTSTSSSRLTMPPPSRPAPLGRALPRSRQRTPREGRNARRYGLLNARHHAVARG